MSYFSRFSLVRAWRDLRLFLSYRTRVELLFGVAALAVTGILILGFYIGPPIEPTYKREIIYADSWPADRTDEQIIAKQKIDQVAREKRLAEIEAARARRQEQFKRIENTMDAWGL